MNMSAEAYVESRDRRPSNREAVLEKLQAHQGQWVPGSELEAAGGGTEATRRVRELRQDNNGGWLIDTEKVDGHWSYRLIGQKNLVVS